MYALVKERASGQFPKMELISDPCLVITHIFIRFQREDRSQVVGLHIDNLANVSPANAFYHLGIGGGMGYLKSDSQTQLSFYPFPKQFNSPAPVHIDGGGFLAIRVFSSGYCCFQK